MKKLLVAACLVVLATGSIPQAVAQDQGGGSRSERADDSAAPAALEQKLKGLTKKDGFIPIYWDARAGKIYLEVTKFDSEFMYVYQTSGAAGTLGIQRGAVARPQIVTFRRVGPKVLLVAKNLLWRTGSNEPYQKLAKDQSFPESVLWGFPIAAEDGPGHVLLDATQFFMRDAPGFAERLSGYRPDASRSAIVPESVKDFPLNLVVETMLTFTNEGGGGTGRGAGGGAGERTNLLNAVTPDARDVTLRERQMLIALPRPGFSPRAWDPRAGQLANVTFNDWSKPLGAPLETRLATRHRLEKKDANAAVSEVKEPIVYYIDRGAPASVRQALLEGTRWWSAAFEAAGFKNAFKAEILPEGADPLDIRYNMVLWVEEAERGFSNGISIVDPRTGEIIKSEVTLTAGRERQDYLITQALLSPYKRDGKPDPQQNEMVMQRIRALAAHEVGHTLGLGHNFAASSFGAGNGSVDDYPFPEIGLDRNGHLDLSHAYENGVGAWDKLVIDYLYKEFSPGTSAAGEKAGLEKILQDGMKKGIYFQAEEGVAAASPHSTQWDNGADAADELDRLMTIRAVALKNFSEAAIEPGEPMATLEDVLVPVYLLHRYQVGAAAQEIGGQDYRYAVRGDGQMVTEIVPASEQRKALAAVLKTLDPAALTLPETLLEKFPPRPPGYGRTQESWGSYNGPSFDAEAPALSAATVTLEALLDPGKASRLVEFHARDDANPSLKEVLDALLKATWYAPEAKGLEGLTQMTVDGAVLEKLTALGAANISPVAKAEVRAVLGELRGWIAQEAKTADGEWKAFYAAQMEAGGAARGGAGAAALAAGPGGGRNGGPAPMAVPAGPPI